MIVLARLLPLAFVCKHSYSPDQIHHPPGSEGCASFPFEYPALGNFYSYVVLQTTERPASYMALVCF